MGCQFDHDYSVEIVHEATVGELALAAYYICLVASGPYYAPICAVGTAIVADQIVSHITAMPDGECLEVGLMYYVDPYAKEIQCSVE